MFLVPLAAAGYVYWDKHQRQQERKNLGPTTSTSSEDGSDDPVEALKQFLQDQAMQANPHGREPWKIKTIEDGMVLEAQVPFSVTAYR